MRNFGRRGQAALEFMMTYGWAILVVLAAIGALSYFGILNPSKFTPDTCFTTSGFSCSGKPVVNNTMVAFSIMNGLGYTANLDDATISYSSTLSSCKNTYFCARGNITCNVSNTTVEDGAGITVVLSGCDFSTLNVVKGEVTIPYINPMSRLQESIIVSVTGKLPGK